VREGQNFLLGTAGSPSVRPPKRHIDMIISLSKTQWVGGGGGGGWGSSGSVSESLRFWRAHAARKVGIRSS